MSYIEAIYPPMFSVEHGLILCKCRCYERIPGGILYCDFAAQRCYEETI